MKRIAFPVLGAVICLQILSGCKETGQSSNVRVAGKSAGANATIAAKKAQEESAVKDTELKLNELKAYGDIVEFMLKNIRDQQADTFGMDAFVKSRQWVTTSLYGKNPDASVLAASRSEGKVGYTAFQTSKAIFIDFNSFDHSDDVEKAKLIVRQIVTGLRLKTKGIVSFTQLSGEANGTQQAELDEARDVLAQANQAPEHTESNDSVENKLSDMPSDANIVGSADSSNLNIDDQQAIAGATKGNTIGQKVERLDATDIEGIRIVTEYLMARGNSAQLAEIKEYLVKYNIIR